MTNTTIIRQCNVRQSLLSELNPWPPAYEAGALPTNLKRQLMSEPSKVHSCTKLLLCLSLIRHELPHMQFPGCLLTNKKLSSLPYSWRAMQPRACHCKHSSARSRLWAHRAARANPGHERHQSLHRRVVGTSRCVRDNPGSTPGGDICSRGEAG